MKESLTALLAGIVDYAGLFPPAKLTMSEAVANYAGFRRDETTWMLGRFILPLARLDEFAAAYANAESSSNSDGLWRLSVIGSGNLADDRTRIEGFNKNEGRANKTPRCVIDALEFKPSTVDDVRLSSDLKRELQIVAREINSGDAQAAFEVFCEIPVGNNADSMLDEIAKAGVSAKVRTGGTSAEMFPNARDLAHFIHDCSRRGIPFKATAGLHHPLRAIYALTYEPDAPRGTMFGFLNVFVAAAFARAGVKEKLLVEILETSDTTDFTFTDERLAWRDLHLDTPAIKRTRGDFAISFGSCSFTEPVEDLKTLNLL